MVFKEHNGLIKCSEATKRLYLILRFVLSFCFHNLTFCLLLFKKYLFLFILPLSGDIEQNSNFNVKLTKCSFLYHNNRGLYDNIKHLQIGCHKYYVILCSKTLDSDPCYVNEISLYGFITLHYSLEIPDIFF